MTQVFDRALLPCPLTTKLEAIASHGDIKLTGPRLFHL